jgi:hypothetical protein
LRDIGELMHPTTKEGAPFRFDTASPDWRERFERSTRSEAELHQGAVVEAARGRAGRLAVFEPPMPTYEAFDPAVTANYRQWADSHRSPEKSELEKFVNFFNPIGGAQGAELPHHSSQRSPYGDLSGVKFGPEMPSDIGSLLAALEATRQPIKLDPVKVSGEAQLYVKVDDSGVNQIKVPLQLSSSGGESKFVGVSGAGHH